MEDINPLAKFWGETLKPGSIVMFYVLHWILVRSNQYWEESLKREKIRTGENPARKVSSFERTRLYL